MCRGSEVLREVAWVIFDEVHYMQDRERGVVWEETIIFLPPETKMVGACFSSIPAALSHAIHVFLSFGSWYRFHQAPCPFSWWTWPLTAVVKYRHTIRTHPRSFTYVTSKAILVATSLTLCSSIHMNLLRLSSCKDRKHVLRSNLGSGICTPDAGFHAAFLFCNVISCLSACEFCMRSRDKGQSAGVRAPGRACSAYSPGKRRVLPVVPGVPVSDSVKCGGVCRVGGGSAQAPLPCGLHRLPAHTPAALCLRPRRQGPLPGAVPVPRLVRKFSMSRHLSQMHS